MLAPMTGTGSPVEGSRNAFEELPAYDGGWVIGDRRAPYFSMVEDDSSVNWSAELESLHEESSRTHFLDRWTRQSLLDGIGPQISNATIIDLGCSTGYLLEDLARAHPSATLIGVDLVAAGLRKAHASVPGARLLHADARALPLADGSVDALVSANLLEHIPDDVQALREARRVLRPGGRFALVVPAGPSTYDYYDRFLGHERRYSRGELDRKCREVGLQPINSRHVGALLYPPFWLVKQRNRRWYGHLRGAALEAKVAADIARTRDSQIGHLAWRVEEWLARAGIRPGFGIRSLVVGIR